jgi:hypothetical protein
LALDVEDSRARIETALHPLIEAKALARVSIGGRFTLSALTVLPT